MIDFNEIRIKPDGKSMVIDVSVKTLYYYDDIYIESIVIDTQNTFKQYGPSDEYIMKIDMPNNRTKSYNIEIPASDFENVSLQDNMFYVYVIANGIPTPDTPCGMDEYTSIHVVFDYGPIYRNTMGLFRLMEEHCNVPQGLIDLILRINGLELALITGHYPQANKYWNKFFGVQRVLPLIQRCGCESRII